MATLSNEVLSVRCKPALETPRNELIENKKMQKFERGKHTIVQDRDDRIVRKYPIFIFLNFKKKPLRFWNVQRNNPPVNGERKKILFLSSIAYYDWQSIHVRYHMQA